MSYNKIIQCFFFNSYFQKRYTKAYINLQINSQQRQIRRNWALQSRQQQSPCPCHICPQGKPNYSQNYWTEFTSFQGVQILFWIRNEKWHQSTSYTSCLVLSPALTFLNLMFRLKLAHPGQYIRPQEELRMCQSHQCGVYFSSFDQQQKHWEMVSVFRRL